MPSCKYTFELLSPIVEKSLSYAEVLWRLDFKQAGDSESNIKRLVQKLGSALTIFLGEHGIRAKTIGDQEERR
jgi:hypothetical protein